MKPLVSVLMPVHHSGKYLEDAITSVLNQAYGDFELIIIDDGSNAACKQMIGNYTDTRIKVHVNKNNIGISRALKKGFDQCDGRYIARMDADDIMDPNRLEEQVKYMESNQEVAVLGSWITLIDDRNRIIGKRQYPVEPEEIRRKILIRNPVAHPTAMVRKAMLPKTVFDDRLITAQDYDLWLRIGRKYALANLPLYLLKYRLHEGAIKSRRANRTHLDTLNIKLRAILFYGYKPGLLAVLYLLGETLALPLPSRLKRKLYLKMVAQQ